MQPELQVLYALVGCQVQRLRRGLASRAGGEAGVSTLEMVIIALGLMAVAGVLVAAVTAAVTNRTRQIK